MSWSIYLAGKNMMVKDELAKAITTMNVAMEHLENEDDDAQINVSLSGSAYEGYDGSGGATGLFSINRIVTAPPITPEVMPAEPETL